MNTMRTSVRRGAWAFAALLALGILLTACGKKAGEGGAKELAIGLQCDRSGPTQSVGAYVCDGFQDYVKLLNKKNGLGEGFAVKVIEIDHGYDVPRGVEAYERFKEGGALTVSLFGTPHTYALTPKLTEDKILGTSPGFGNAASMDGTKFPYIFPIAATYWSQGASAVKFIMDNWKGAGKPKIAYLYYDNPAGREPLDVLRDLSKQLAFEMKEYAVPPPGIEMRPQVLDIARSYKADWVIAHLFGRSPGVSIKEFAQVDFPRNRMISLVWGSSENDIAVAGWEEAEGYYGMQFASVGDDFPVIKEIVDMYAAEGKPKPEAMKVSVHYNRGVLIAALHTRAIQLAVEKHGYPVTGEQVKEAMETIRDFDLGGFLPPLNLSPQDHEGGGWVRLYQVKGGKWVPATDWFQGFRDVVLKHVADAKATSG
jgi:branched-chain amino acid transport system substrate-binding protein